MTRVFICFYIVFSISVVCGAQDRTCADDPSLLRDKTTGKPVIFKGEELRKKLILHERPKFPLNCRCQGSVVARILINPKGEVACVDVLSGHPLLRANVSEAVKKWRFEITTIEEKLYSIAGLIIFTFESAGAVFDNVFNEKPYCQIHTDNLVKYSIYPDELRPQETKKRVIYQIAPTCPESIDCEATMTVDVDVNQWGKVECVTLPNRGHPLLKAAVAEAVRGWKFRPLKVKEKPVYFNGQLSVSIKSQ